MKKLLLLLPALFLLNACGPSVSDYKADVPVTPISQRVSEPETKANGTKAEPESEKPSVPAQLPKQVNLDVPFYPQAPDADWSNPWQEACEESSVILAYYYKKGLPLSKDVFRQQVLDIVEWQKETFGHWMDTNLDKTSQMLSDYFGYEGELEIIDNPSVRDIKTALAAGHPVIAPFAGRQLGNPFFSGAGPWYHMAVIKGYDETQKQFIVNDVGTSRGENFLYDYTTIMSALHDWNGSKTNIEGGAKRILIVK